MFAAHNVHTNVGRLQEGGAALVAYGPIIEQLDLSGSNKDESGLVRFVTMTFLGSKNVKTKVVCGYNPCFIKKQGSTTVYQHHRRHFTTKIIDLTYPLIPTNIFTRQT